MNRFARFAAVFLAAVVLPWLAPVHADPSEDPADAEEPDLVLPLHPFANVQPGDWCVLKYRVSGEAAEGLPQTEHDAVFRVHETARENIVLSAATYRPDGPTHVDFLSAGAEVGTEGLSSDDHYRLPREKAGTLRAFLTVVFPINFRRVVFRDQAVGNGTKSIGGREFACKKVTARIWDKESGWGDLELWLASKAGGLHLVSLEIHTKAQSKDLFIQIEIAGFGTKDGTTWGISEEEAANRAKSGAKQTTGQTSTAEPKSKYWKLTKVEQFEWPEREHTVDGFVTTSSRYEEGKLEFRSALDNPTAPQQHTAWAGTISWSRPPGVLLPDQIVNIQSEGSVGLNENPVFYWRSWITINIAGRGDAETVALDNHSHPEGTCLKVANKSLRSPGPGYPGATMVLGVTAPGAFGCYIFQYVYEWVD